MEVLDKSRLAVGGDLVFMQVSAIFYPGDLRSIFNLVWVLMTSSLFFCFHPWLFTYAD